MSLFPTPDSIRDLVIQSFDPKDYHFYHQTPYRYRDFIDGMAWLGILCGACYKVGDRQLAKLCEGNLNSIIWVGKDARNYAPTLVNSDWKASTSMSGYWYIEKAQACAGPLGLQYAINNGAAIICPDYLKSMAKNAMRLTSLGWIFGISSKYGFLSDHANTMFTAHLVSGKKIPSTMLWMCEENPFFSYIAGKKCDITYPMDKRYVKEEETTDKKVVPFQNAKPCAWPFRRDPFMRYDDAGTGELETDAYVPVYRVVGDYLQSTLG